VKEDKVNVDLSAKELVLKSEEAERDDKVEKVKRQSTMHVDGVGECRSDRIPDYLFVELCIAGFRGWDRRFVGRLRDKS
jgi:hypothetical protein